LTATVHYSRLNIGAPVSLAIRETGVRWGSYVVNAGALAGIKYRDARYVAWTIARFLFNGARWVALEMGGGRSPQSSARRGSRPPSLARCSRVLASLSHWQFGAMVSIGTLLAFVIVCGAVIILRKRRPDLPRPFKTPMVPLVPILGIVVSLGLMASLNRVTWYRFGYMGSCRMVHLFPPTA